MYKLAMSVLRGEHAWLEKGIAAENTEMGITMAQMSDDDTDEYIRTPLLSHTLV